eukprot:TRINITY_DN4258_c0_g1_i1.p1 TRINITY_DN4258_c0_g1~~TRINITY_DN4258_c0_g1_i1.p1  ORF type:complete len:403 (-),score=125.08 TRINITY_DN4258_c0_g1_i1:50-1258(-)
MEQTAFWGLELQSGKKYTQAPERPFKITAAVLTDVVDPKERNIVYCQVEEGGKYALCALRPDSAEQVQLNIDIGITEPVTFFCSGKNTVHLTGYVYWDPHEDDYSSEDYDSDALMGGSSDEDDERLRIEELPSSPEDSSNSDSDEEGEGLDYSTDDSDLESDNADSDDGSSDSDSDSDSDARAQIDGSRKRGADSAESKSKKVKVEPEQKPAKKEAKPAVTASPVQQELTKSQRRKLAKEAKKAATATGDAQPKQQPPKQEPKKEEKKPEPKKEEKQTQQQKKEDKEPGLVRTIAGGVQVKDIEIGKGKEAKAGKVVKVLYQGRLQNGKVFDKSVDRKKPFSFRLGVGEVIKGWDVGFAGMFVGGKRKLTIPAPMAYGKRGAPPDIPPQATLLFDVELIDVN